MAVGLIFIGLVLLIAGARNTQGALFSQVHTDLTGQNNFVYWMLAIIMIGALGYIPRVKPFSVALLVLVFVAIALKSGTGFFAQLQKALQSTATASTSTTATAGSSNG